MKGKAEEGKDARNAALVNSLNVETESKFQLDEELKPETKVEVGSGGWGGGKKRLKKTRQGPTFNTASSGGSPSSG